MMIAKHAAAEFFKINGKSNNEMYNKDISTIMEEVCDLKQQLYTE